MGCGMQGTWSDRDRLLLVALTLHEQGICQGCGQPRSISHDGLRAGEFDVLTDTCLGCESLETHREHDKSKARGQKSFVVHSSD